MSSIKILIIDLLILLNVKPGCCAKIPGTFALLLICLSMTAGVQTKTQKVTIVAKNITVENVLIELNRQTGYSFFWPDNYVIASPKISLNLKDVELHQALDVCLKNMSLTYRIDGRTKFVYLIPADPKVQSRPDEVAAIRNVIEGKVTDSDGEALPGTSVRVKGTQRGTSAAADGSFSIEADPGEVLHFSSIGFQPLEVVVSAATSLQVRLVAEVAGLNEVVVTAMGIKREVKSLGYSVTKVDGDDFSKSRELNFVNSLTGKVAGVNVTGVGSNTNGSSRVTIRGNTSISADNQPLYIINGLPMDNSKFGGPAYGMPDWGDNISSLNAEDIEEITVLKGATAAALYGSRAKNGAIVVTTKSGRGQKGIGVEITSHNTFEVPYFLWDIQKEYGQGYGGVRPQSRSDAANHSQNHWGERFDDQPTFQFDGEKRPYTYMKDELLENFYRTGKTFMNTVSFSGGNNTSSFRLGVTHMRNQGIISKADMERTNISLGVNHRINEKINITANVDYVTEDIRNRYMLAGGRGGHARTVLMVASSMGTNALSPGYDNNYNEMTLGTDLNATNPYFVINRMRNSTGKDRFITSLTGRWDIKDWLFFQAKAGQDFYTFDLNNMIPDGTGYLKNGRIDKRNINFWERNFEGLIGLQKNLDERFALAVNLGGNLMSQRNVVNSVTGSGFVVPQYHNINNTATREIQLGGYEKKINSLFGTAEISYNNMLFLNVTGRNDWFSTLSPESNNFFYPSVGASFVFTEGFKLPEMFDFGKLRVAYASVGGDADPYGLNLTYSLLGYKHGDIPLGTINQIIVPNNKIKPLSVDEFELGTDVRMFRNRLGADFAFYNKLTTNDIAIESISSTSGYAGTLVNVGKIRNRGVELLITAKPYVTDNFAWDVSANYSFNKSKVLKISNSTNELILDNYSKAFIKHIEGQEYSQIVGRYILKNEKGQEIMDQTGLPIVSNEVMSFGSGIHKHIIGLTNNVKYKGFNLSVLVDGKFGAKIYSETNYSLDHRGLSKSSLIGRKEGAILPGVNEKGETNTVLVTADRVNNRAIIVRRRDALDDYLYDASFIKLRNVTLSYDIPRPLLNGTGFVRAATVSLVGRNLWILMSRAPGIDPETNMYSGNSQGMEANGLPPTRSIGFNINLKF